MTRPVFEPTTQREIRKNKFSADQLFRRPAPHSEAETISESCMPPPGTLVRPAFKQRSGLGEQPALLPFTHYPGGVIAASLKHFTPHDDAVAAERKYGPSRNSSAITVFDATNYDDTPTNASWSFRPVDDFDCTPGMLYGIFYSFLWSPDGATGFHLEGRSTNTSTTDTLYDANGTRHPNVLSTPDTLEWWSPGVDGDPPALGYYGMWPVGGNNYYGDWPLQGGSPSIDVGGVAFEAGETITIRCWTDSGAGADTLLYLDSLYFMPSLPLGVTDDSNYGSETLNFRSSALTAYGYVPTSSPGSITNPSDTGMWFSGDTVDDTQTLETIYDPAMHFTVASHDESDIEGIFSGVGGLHVYVLCRAVGVTQGTSNTHRCGGHLTCFTNSESISDILCDEQGGWLWGYAGRMPLGDSPQGSFGIVQWISDNEVFWNLDPPTSVRSAFIAYLPQAPCEAP